MARSTTVESELGGIPGPIKARLVAAFRYVLDQGLRLGRPDDQGKSENFAQHFYRVTTPGVADTEFTVAHGLGKTPYLIVPVLPVETVGAQIVPLKVTRAADDVRVYLSSSTASADITISIEG